MKLLKAEACHLASAGGNVKEMTVMGDALMDRLSDRGSIPLRSICGKCLKTLDFRHFPYFILVNFMLLGSFQDVSV